MLKVLLVAVAMSLFSSACFNSYAENHSKDVESLVVSLRGSQSFWLYFVTMTEEYSLEIDQIKEKSSIRIYRSCGADCANVLNLLVQHLRSSKRIECISGAGMENVLLSLSSGVDVVYSHGGRQMELNGRCYLNDVSVNKILDQTGYIFR